MLRVTEAEVALYVDAVPSFPAFAKEVIEAANDEAKDMGDIVAKIVKDATLAARVISHSNLAVNHLMNGRVCGTVNDAVSFLGMDRVRDIVVDTLLRAAFDVAVIPGGHHWDHATMVATGTRVVSRRCDVDPHVCHIAGLLHDIGQLWLQRRYAGPFQDALQKSGEGMDITRAEREVFGEDHAFVGHALAKVWGLPRAIADGIGYHHAPSHGESLVAHVVHLAEVLAAALRRDDEVAPIPALDPMTVTTLGLSSGELTLMLGEIEARSLFQKAET